MNVLEIRYLKNNISENELEYIKQKIPKRYAMSQSYKSEESRNLSLLSGIMIYNNLKVDEDDIKYNKLKKPYIENGLFFNVSHSKEYVVFAKSEKEIGIDIECINEKNMSIIDFAFNEEEKKYILSEEGDTSIEKLTKMWTIKESLFKASGSEKYIEPKNIDAIAWDKKYNIYSMKFLNYIISVASVVRYDNVRLVEDVIIKE